jgi:hypothetical protein
MTNLRTGKEWLEEASKILRETDSKTFDRAAQARFESCMRLSEACRAGDVVQIFLEPNQPHSFSTKTALG